MGNIDEEIQPRLLTQRNLGPDPCSTNSMTSGRHLTYMSWGFLVYQTKGSYCSREKGQLLDAFKRDTESPMAFTRHWVNATVLLLLARCCFKYKNSALKH